ncbi:MAG: glycine zipper 2TM domain-containing protein, partial [Steroidobacteraceae bacterium]
MRIRGIAPDDTPPGSAKVVRAESSIAPGIRRRAMNNSLLAGAILGAVVLTAVGAYASTRVDLNPWKDYADVIAVAPAVKTNRIARQSCRDEAVTQQVPVKDEKRIAGTAIGAVVGGVLGSQVGHGDGQKLATVAGAVAGGYAGNKVQQRMQDGNTATVVEPVCETVYDSNEVADGYTVTYMLDGTQGTVHMDHNPGVRIPVKDG